ncbi:MAG: bifunctional riboflavin kinase/FAD synthetase [Planctomycetes bacterium]|nr:bifunctional riboflavin kinase/FAD synthetase [Planctomycetota bacterium]
MTLLRGFEDSLQQADGRSCRGGILAIGNFDGVHCGHRQMFSVLVERAAAENVPAVAITFDPHPLQILRPELAPPNLCTLPRKAELIEQCGVEFVLALPTDRNMLLLSPEQFFAEIIQEQLAARGLVEGPNFCFGKNRSGNINTLRTLCERGGLSLDVLDPVTQDGEMVSSSLIRDRIAAGDVARAAELLGQPYRITGTVIRGANRGRTLGFPTANLSGVETLLPADGVYAGRAFVGEITRPAAIHIGPNPTFGESSRKLEVHLLDFHDDVYAQPLDVEFLARVRDVRPFPDTTALKEQLQRDITAVRAVADHEKSH